MNTVPGDGRYSPARILIRVLLPHPLFPARTTTDPGGISMEMSFRTAVPWTYSKERSRTVIDGLASSGTASPDPLTAPVTRERAWLSMKSCSSPTSTAIGSWSLGRARTSVMRRKAPRLLRTSASDCPIPANGQARWLQRFTSARIPPIVSLPWTAM